METDRRSLALILFTGVGVLIPVGPSTPSRVGPALVGRIPELLELACVSGVHPTLRSLPLFMLLAHPRSRPLSRHLGATQRADPSATLSPGQPSRAIWRDYAAAQVVMTNCLWLSQGLAALPHTPQPASGLTAPPRPRRPWRPVRQQMDASDPLTEVNVPSGTYCQAAAGLCLEAFEPRLRGRSKRRSGRSDILRPRGKAQVVASRRYWSIPQAPPGLCDVSLTPRVLGVHRVVQVRPQRFW